MANAEQETKAQRVERLKKESNPWERLDEIRRFAREGFGSIPPEWLGTYFRWWGVYTQGDGAGVELVHVNVPEEDFAGVSQGWEKYYWAPCRAYPLLDNRSYPSQNLVIASTNSASFSNMGRWPQSLISLSSAPVMNCR